LLLEPISFGVNIEKETGLKEVYKVVEIAFAL
jgi:hypothetical protein